MFFEEKQFYLQTFFKKIVAVSPSTSQQSHFHFPLAWTNRFVVKLFTRVIDINFV